MSVTIEQTAIPSIAPTFRLQWEEAQGCHVILYPEGMVKLNPSAGEILKHCDGSANVAEIIATLESTFPGTDLSGDVIHFLEEAHDHGWIQI